MSDARIERLAFEAMQWARLPEHNPGNDQPSLVFARQFAFLMEVEPECWLPIVFCPTDGVWRMCRLADGRAVVAAFDGHSIGDHARRWRIKEFAYHNPARPSGEVRGGVEQMIAAYDTHVVTDLPGGSAPTHFRPNDTVHGEAKIVAPISEGQP